jgi:putative flippase GtrA
VRFARALYQRFQVLVHEMAKFGVVGAINTVLHFGLFNLLHLKYGWGPLTSNGIAIAVAATSSYFMNRHWTFRHRARTGAGREYSLFFLLNGVGWIISQACVGITTYVLGLTGALASNAALVVGVALGMGFRFATYKRWVFLPLEDDEPVEPVASEAPAGPVGGTPAEPGTSPARPAAVAPGPGRPESNGQAPAPAPARPPAGDPAADRAGRSGDAATAQAGTGW